MGPQRLQRPEVRPRSHERLWSKRVRGEGLKQNGTTAKGDEGDVGQKGPTKAMKEAKRSPRCTEPMIWFQAGGPGMRWAHLCPLPPSVCAAIAKARARGWNPPAWNPGSC